MSRCHKVTIMQTTTVSHLTMSPRLLGWPSRQDTALRSAPYRALHPVQ
jgi:hypothetical protein